MCNNRYLAIESGKIMCFRCSWSKIDVYFLSNEIEVALLLFYPMGLKLTSSFSFLPSRRIARLQVFQFFLSPCLPPGISLEFVVVVYVYNGCILACMLGLEGVLVTYELHVSMFGTPPKNQSYLIKSLVVIKKGHGLN
jgi:hypothetical protein